MKSIKNQYIALKEGKMTEAQFMRNVRMTLPEYISNVTLFKQAERILINKGIIQEGIHDRDILSSPHTNIKSLEQSPEQLSKAADDRSENMLRMKYSKQIQDPNTSNDELRYLLSGKGVKGFGGTPNAIEKIIADRNSDKIEESLKEAKDTSATGYYNQDGKEQYSKFDELDNMNAQEIMAGYVMEKQDNPNIDQKEAVKLVIKNLKTDQFYYTNYKLTGIRGLKPTEFTTTKRKPFFDQMEEVDKNGNNFVDEKNKMVIVKEGLETQEAEQDLVAIADDIYNELQALGSYDDMDVAKLLNTYPNLSPDEEREIEVIIFDRDREELMETSIIPESQKSKLKEMIRKMMKEMFDGMEPLSRTGLDA